MAATINGSRCRPRPLPGALLSGRVDAATLLNTQAWKAGKDPKFRTLIRLGRDVHEVFGGPPASAIFVSYPEKLAARPAVFKEALRMLKASADYTKSHKDEVYAAVAKATGTETALFEFFYETYAQVPMAVSAADVASMNRLWKYTKEMGTHQKLPKGRIGNLGWRNTGIDLFNIFGAIQLRRSPR